MCLPACIRFCRSGIFCLAFLAQLQMPPFGQADSGLAFGIFLNPWKSQSRSFSLVQKHAQGDELRNLCKKVAMRHTVAFPLLALPQNVRFLWFRGWSDGVRSIDRGRNPRQDQCCNGWQRSWSGCACLPACCRFFPFRHLLPGFLAHL